MMNVWVAETTMKSVAPSSLARSTPTLPSSGPWNEPRTQRTYAPIAGDDAQAESYRAQLTRDARGVGPEFRGGGTQQALKEWRVREGVDQLAPLARGTQHHNTPLMRFGLPVEVAPDQHSPHRVGDEMYSFGFVPTAPPHFGLEPIDEDFHGLRC